jgi:uncharacterized protein DUF748
LHGPRWLVIPGIVFVGLVVVYAMLNTIAAFATRRALDRMHGIEGTFQRVNVSLWPPGYDVYRLKLVEKPVTPQKLKAPLAYADRVEMRWSWGQLFHRHKIRSVKLVGAKFRMPVERGKAAGEHPLNLARALQAVPTAALAQLSFVDSEVLVIDEKMKGHPTLWLHHLNGSLENLATRPERMGGRPAMLTLRGAVQRSGELTVFLTTDPFDRGLTFACSAELRNLELSDLYQFTKAEKLAMPRGSIDVFVSLASRRGKLRGTVKPFLKNVTVEAAGNAGLGDKIKAALADTAVQILSDRVPGRNAVATEVAIHGDLSHVNKEVFPAIVTVLRNAFVEGIAESLTRATPPKHARAG